MFPRFYVPVERRTSFLLNGVLLQHKYPPINIRLRDRGRYYKCLQEYDYKNDVKSTLKFLISQYKKQF